MEVGRYYEHTWKNPTTATSALLMKASAFVMLFNRTSFPAVPAVPGEERSGSDRGVHKEQLKEGPPISTQASHSLHAHSHTSPESSTCLHSTRWVRRPSVRRTPSGRPILFPELGGKLTYCGMQSRCLQHTLLGSPQ